MFIPAGFSENSFGTSLGELAYYTNNRAPWNDSELSDRPKLVFLHALGGGSSAYEWSKVYPAFANEYRILAPDMLGWGRSAHPERNYAISDYTTTIEEFIRGTCSQPVTVIASGLTAAFTVRVAIAYPQLFKSLILVTAAGLNEFGTGYQDNFFTKLAGTPVVDRLLYNTGVATSFGIRGYMEQRQFAKSDRIYPELIEAYQMSAQQPGAEYSALSFVRGDLCFDLSQGIENLKTPTALIWGRESEYIGPRVGRLLQQRNPEAIKIMHQMEDVGFTPHLELPAITMGLIRMFMSQLNRSDVNQAVQAS